MTDKAWCSVIDYRPDPARPEYGRIPLGVAIEAVIGGSWNVGVWIRSALSARELERLDGIGKELLATPSTLIFGQMRRILSEDVPQPGDALSKFADGLKWSIHATAPRACSFKARTEESASQAMERLLTAQYAMSVVGEKAIRAPSGRPAVQESEPLPWAFQHVWRVPKPRASDRVRVAH